MQLSKLSEQMEQIQKNVQEKQLTRSMMEDSLRFDPDAYLDELAKSMHKSKLLQKQEETKTKIDELEYSQNLTQSQLNNLIKFTNKHLSKLCDAVLMLQRDVEELKKDRLDRMCECEANNCCGCGCCECSDCEGEEEEDLPECEHGCACGCQRSQPAQMAVE